VREFTVAGGLLKNPLVMQIYADVLRRPLHAIESDEGPALGAACTPRRGRAPSRHRGRLAAMGRAAPRASLPDAESADAYDLLYEHYSALHDHFGDGAMMHALHRPRRAKRQRSDGIADLRRRVCELHAELPKHVSSSGRAAISRRASRARPHGDQGERVDFDR